jgi:3-phenylpropionate/cinnamic acid dioxygenase small subunit
MAHADEDAVTTPEITHRFERLLFTEARLLDQTRYEEWLAMLSDRVRYRAPVRSNLDEEDLAAPRLLTLFDDKKSDLVTRVKRIRTEHAHAEQPPSRVRRLVSNVFVVEANEDSARISSSFLVTVSRWDQPAKVFSGSREDRWDVEDGAWKLAERTIVFDLSTTQNVSFLL